MTGADRTWAARYENNDMLQYTTRSKGEGIERGTFATVRSIDTHANTLSVELESGYIVTYDPHRLRGVNVFREIERGLRWVTGFNGQLQIRSLELPIET